MLAPPAGTADDVNWLFEQSIRGCNDSARSQMRFSYDKEAEEEKVDLDRIDLMEPIEFEAWVLDRLEKRGYEVKTTPISGDAGSDGIAISPDSSCFPSFIIQCKHTQRDVNIGHSAVEEILNAMDRYEFLPKGIKPLVVTNAKGFTAKANSLSRNRGVRVVSREGLEKL